MQLRPEPADIFAFKTHHLVGERPSDILTVMTLIMSDYPVTGGMQTSYLLSGNPLLLQAQQILLEGKDLIQNATNTARVHRDSLEQQCSRPREQV